MVLDLFIPDLCLLSYLGSSADTLVLIIQLSSTKSLLQINLVTKHFKSSNERIVIDKGQISKHTVSKTCQSI